jgi:NAD(P)-dependent dehydrogenase (short-subunit alcohol dehydrogenase family)
VTTFSDIVDTALEGTLVGSFTRIGAVVRRSLDRWDAEPLPSLAGRVAVVTGATSGLGLVTAQRLAALGAHVCIVARDAAKAERVSASITKDVPGASLTIAQGDTGHLDDMRRVAREIAARHERVDVLIHNAGALDAARSESPEGIETTVASHVVGPFVLTRGLLPSLERAGASSPPARVLWVSSGGMYAEPLDTSRLQMPHHGYDGVVAYARAKRAQVTLSEMLAERLEGRGIVVHAMHPGWADTPGVARSLPRFRAVLGPLLRSPSEGADTLVWLASSRGLPCSTTGRFWLDRRTRAIHKLGRTRESDTSAERERFSKWLARVSGEPEGWP